MNFWQARFWCEIYIDLSFYLVEHEDPSVSQILQLLSQFTITFSIFVCNLK